MPIPEANTSLLWTSRAAWLLLPLTVGAVIESATDAWSSAPTITFAVFAYMAWVVGLVALLLPSDRSFTTLRIVATLPLAAAIWGAWSASLGATTIAVAHATFACVCSLSAPIADRCTQAQAYGDEIRRALRTPPALCVATSVSVALIVAACGGGPLLWASGHTVIGIVGIVVGLPVVALLTRSVHTLSKRFVVFVPAGLVVSDNVVLADPVLLPSERIVRFAAFDGVRFGGESAPPTVDTRGGANAGSIAVQLNDGGSFAVRDGRNRVRMVDALHVLFTPLRPSEFLALAGPATANPHVPKH